MPTQAHEEARELSRLAAEELSALPHGIGDVHAAIAGRVFGALGPTAEPVRRVHDTISRGAYGGVRGGLWLGAHAAGTAARRRAGERPLSSTPRGAAVIAALNGLYGDRFEREQSALALSMAVRAGGEPVKLTADALAAAFPDAAPQVVVFVHGLGETEFSWGGYGEQLRTELGCTPVYVRFNSGRHVSENGALLDALLDALVAAWPVTVDRLEIVGHSMGGLVARSAGFRGAERGADWTGRVRHVVSLGTPHMGAPLEQAVHAMSVALHAVPETRPFSRFLRRRSAGIRDLRHGSLVDEDWRDQDPEALRARACREVPLLEGVTHCFVAATITRSGKHPVARLLGDALVLAPSASGRSRTRRIAFEEEFGLALGGTHHLALLNHPEVAAKLREWLATGYGD